MSEPKRIRCKSLWCRRTILPDTAQRTGGFCMPCVQKAAMKKREEFLKNRPNPAQKSLDALLSPATRLRILEGGVSDDKAIGKKVLLDTHETSAASKIAKLLRIVEDPATFGHCMCLGSYALEFYEGQKLLATIGLHHGQSIRWDGWQWDAWLSDRLKLLEGLKELGVNGPLAEFMEDERRREEGQRAGKLWLDATPACLRSFWQEMQDCAPDLKPMSKALKSAFPELGIRVLELFRWFGSAHGPWSGYPIYQGVPESLLLEYTNKELLTVIADADLSSDHLEGIARLFAGHEFRNGKRHRKLELPESLRQKLLQHCMASGDEYKVRCGTRSFGPSSEDQ